MPESHLAACELCGKDGCRVEGAGGEGVNGTDLLLYVSTVQSRYTITLIFHVIPQVVFVLFFSKGLQFCNAVMQYKAIWSNIWQ